MKHPVVDISVVAHAGDIFFGLLEKAKIKTAIDKFSVGTQRQVVDCLHNGVGGSFTNKQTFPDFHITSSLCYGRSDIGAHFSIIVDICTTGKSAVARLSRTNGKRTGE